MLYRILADAVLAWTDHHQIRQATEDGTEDASKDGATDGAEDSTVDLWRTPSGTQLGGAYMGGGPCRALDGLPMPPLRNRRVRFWFTEAGWGRFGRDYAAELSAAGHVIRVLRIKNPPLSRVAYRDPYQVALLPPPMDE